MVSRFPSKYLKYGYNAVFYLKKSWLSASQITQIQAHFTVSGVIADPLVAGKLIAFLATSNHVGFSYIHNFFRLLTFKSSYAYTSIIRFSVEKDEFAMAKTLHKQMIRDGFSPNNYTFSFVLRACTVDCEFSMGLVYHAQVVKLGWGSYDFVQNGLIHMYATCGCLSSARELFDVSLNRDVITWTAVINGYLKAGQIVTARKLFDGMPEKNAVAWSAIINGYVQAELFEEALELFRDMQHTGIPPNYAGIVGALSACAFLGALDQGRWIHAYVEKHQIKLDLILGTALIDMYSKCGCIEAASCVFEEMPNRDVYAYTSLISGLSNHGLSDRAIAILKQMQKEEIKPNEVTFISILSACSRMGLVDEGLQIFYSMKDVYGIEPGIQHYGCLVDLLGRAGVLEQATKVVSEMPIEPDSCVLGALLNACRVYGNVDLGKQMVEGLVEKSLDHSGVHVLLSNIYASADQWDHVERVRKGMEEEKVNKVPGCSFVEVDGVVHEFVAGDRSQELLEKIELPSQGIKKHFRSLWFDDAEDSNDLENFEQVYM